MATTYTDQTITPTKVIKTTTTKEEAPLVSIPTTQVVTTDTMPATKFSFKLVQIIWFFITLLEILLAFRIALGLFGANYTGFTQFIYTLSYPFVAPFIGIFNTPRVDRSYFDTAALVAMFVWPLLGWIVTEVLKILDDRT